MLVALYKTKKELKASIGKPFQYQETSVFGVQCIPGKLLTVIGPRTYDRRWYATVKIDSEYKITKVK